MSLEGPAALVGGPSCLDLANTVGPRLPDPATPQRDDLPDVAALLAWATRAGVLTPGQHDHLAARAAAEPARAAQVHRDALRLREAIYRTFAAVARGERAAAPDLAVLQDAYLDALGSARLEVGRPDATGPEPGWRWPERGPLEQVLWPLACSAVDLAITGPPSRIKQCPGDDGRCGWLFLDTSKSATRRWCSMATCGSRLKSRRQAARVRAARTPR